MSTTCLEIGTYPNPLSPTRNNNRRYPLKYACLQATVVTKNISHRNNYIQGTGNGISLLTKLIKHSNEV